MGNHNKRKKYAGAHVLFHRLLKAGNGDFVQGVLLCKRTQDVATHPGYWSMFGGEPKQNDSTAKETALREAREELEATGVNLRIIPIECLCEVLIGGENGPHTVEYFSYFLEIDMDRLRLKRSETESETESETREEKVEGEGLAWFTAEEIHHLTVRPTERVAINKFFQKYGV